ncbi:ABC transporter transmembrane domain-containing protein [Kineococcus rhizosphaerae]|uniref:Putative ABC transport system ATP-binding protein n=1 Tax=Kineococcus rhizosphaerae TaxID=559628 RepID=A0A2T0R023_9ACTN|nr:ABC transporter ATP-binding protein [Kineococcus rhizosphaerae]PRY12470.1 putative ABC transport system ATP-binding protein [Kineococcus rhizosphaerae]
MSSRPVLDVLRRHRRAVAVGCGSSMVHQTCEALVPVAIGLAVDRAVGTGDVRAVVLCVLGVLALFAVLSSAGTFAFWTVDVAEFDEAHSLRTSATSAVLRDPAVLRDRQVGDVLSVVTSDTRHTAESLGLVSFLASGCFGMVVAAVVLLRIDVALGLGLLVSVPVVVLGLQALAPRLERRVHDRQRSAGLAAAVAADLLAGLRPLRGFGGVPEAVRRYHLASAVSRRAAVGAAGATSVLVGAGTLATGAILVATAAAAGALVARGRLDLGEFVTVVGMASFLADPVRNVSACVQQLAVSRASARRVAALLTPPAPRTEAGRPRAGHLSPAPGEVLGIVATDTATADAVTAGFAGAGTLVEPAETHLLGETLADALTTGPVPAGRGVELGAALAAAAAPTDLDAPLADGGTNFSGGQRQRIGLARALAADREVLVLRDPTTALDAVTEDRVAAGVRRLRAGVGTTVLVTSSPLLLTRCDRVVLLTADGRHATGTHTELLDDPRFGAEYAAAVSR